VYSIDCTHQEMLTTESLSMYGKQLKDSLVRAGSAEVFELFDLKQSNRQNGGNGMVLNRPATTAQSLVSQHFGNGATSVEVIPAVCPFRDLQDQADDIEAEPQAGANGLRYADYLNLNELLGAVRPLFGDDDRSCWSDERYFLVIHQVSEIWVSQILVDLELAVDFARLADFDRAIDRLMRANAVLDLIVTTTSALQHLTVDGFLAFRSRLGGASALQSEQFATLLTGVRCAPVAALLEIVADRRNGDSATRRQRLQLGAQLDVFIAGLTRWRLAHIAAVGRFIRESRGTAGTAGVNYLIDRLDKASLRS